MGSVNSSTGNTVGRYDLVFYLVYEDFFIANLCRFSL